MLRVHLDTDIGGDPDDVAALALLLGSEAVDLITVTTCLERRGTRAARARYALELGGRPRVPVVAGADARLDGSIQDYELQDTRYWPDDARWDTPTSDGAAERRLIESIEAGATVIAIGPLTNLARAERISPGILRRTEVVVMGGFTELPPAGLPQWGPEMNFNFEADAPAARSVFDACDPLIVPLHVCMPVAIRATHIPALSGGGALAQLVAMHSELHARDTRMAELASRHTGLPADLLNFQWDPVACGAALRWESIAVSKRPLALLEHDEGLVLEPRRDAPAREIVTSVDAEGFNARWLECARRV